MTRAWRLPLLLCLWMSGCDVLWAPFRTPHPGDGGAGDGAQPLTLDVLFLISNTSGMSGKQLALGQHIAPFFQELDSLGVDYHIGVATSDVGSFPSATSPFQPDPNHDYRCQTFAGDDGALQHTACTASGRLSAEAQGACAKVCPDGSFVPDGSFIAKSGGVTNVPRHLVMGDGGAMIDDGPVRAFQCMALVGDTGCAISGPLEGARRALDGHDPQNAGFLRPGSILVLIFVADEDDCSVQAARRDQNEPLSMNCPTPGPSPDFHCFNPEFRCIAQDLTCNEPLYTTGTKNNCTERPESYLESVSSYVAFFQQLRPAKQLVIGGIWPPVLRGPDSQFVVSQLGPGGTTGLNRGVGTSASCYSADLTIFGRPQLRLSSFIDPFTNLFEINVCAPSDYESGLAHLTDRLGELVGEQ